MPLFNKSLPEPRWLDPMAQSPQHRRANSIFKDFHISRQSRLGCIQTFCRSAHRAGFDNLAKLNEETRIQFRYAYFYQRRSFSNYAEITSYGKVSA